MVSIWQCELIFRSRKRRPALVSQYLSHVVLPRQLPNVRSGRRRAIRIKEIKILLNYQLVKKHTAVHGAYIQLIN